MTSDPLNDVLDNLSHMPKIHRTLQQGIFKNALAGFSRDVTRHHLEILKVLRNEGTLHIAEIADLLLISKPQMTRLLDELIELQLVERQPDTEDRRKINITLTDKGQRVSEEFRLNIEESIRTWLSALNDDELRELSNSLKTIGNIISKLR